VENIVKVSSKGQTVLPAAVRQKADINRGDVLTARVFGGKVVLEPLKKGGTTDWQGVLRDTAGA